MKQGSGRTVMAGVKREPIVRTVNPGAVSQIGVHQALTRAPAPMFSGATTNGLAPKSKVTCHCSGSQGKH